MNVLFSIWSHAGSRKYGNEPSSSITSRKLPDQLSDYQLLKDSVPLSYLVIQMQACETHFNFHKIRLLQTFQNISMKLI
jgi:hypothetical protein